MENVQAVIGQGMTFYNKQKLINELSSANKRHNESNSESNENNKNQGKPTKI